VTKTDPAPRPTEIPASRRTRAATPLPHVDARTTGWLIAQRARIRELELASARLRGELEVSARVERGAQRVCDRLEDEIARSRKREATLARALGYAEAERDQLQEQLAAPKQRGLLGRRKR